MEQVMEQPVSRYPYKPMTEPFEIRVLELAPASGLSSSIQCQLQHVNLSKGFLNFEALSYTWDGNVFSEFIWIDGHPTKVTKNLDSFLRHRREMNEPVVLWVDALCINQEDVKERNNQVAQMTFVYLRAMSLSIWLGPSSEDSDIAIDTLQTLACGTPFHKGKVLTKEETAAINNLLNRNWWNRVWILQEMTWGALEAKLESVWIRCGTNNIRWRSLVKAAARILVWKDRLRNNIPRVKHVLAMDELRSQSGANLREILMGNGTDVKAHDLLGLLSTYRHFHSTDPRDKIYGLLGVLFDKALKPFSKIAINYSLESIRVYKDFAQLIFEWTSDLELLRHVRGRSIDNLPSWVPDWSFRSVELPLPSSKVGIQRYLPWWISLKSVPGDPSCYQYCTNQREIRREMERKLDVRNRIRWNAPSRRFMNAISNEGATSIIEMMNKGHLIMCSLYDEDDVDASDTTELSLSDIQERIVRDTEAKQQRNFYQETLESIERPRVRYSVAGSSTTRFYLFDEADELKVDGVLWDTIASLQDPFPDELESDWADSTFFMVTVGKCKAMAMLYDSAPNPYISVGRRLEAFWKAIFAGQEPFQRVRRSQGADSIDSRYSEWLPLVSETWKESVPPVTFIDPGQTELAEMQRCVEEYRPHFPGHAPVIDTGASDGESSPAYLGFAEDKLEITDDERAALSKIFQELGTLWKLQPYDLYHRPFVLPAVVPDPLWDDRCVHDQRALEQSFQSRNERWDIKELGDMNPNGPRSIEKRQWKARAFKNGPSLVPPEVGPPGLEKYALGRRFFVTKKGYLGICPKHATEGDRVAILLGTEVPFVLRQRQDGGYEVIGEAYVHGIMNGEAVQDLGADNVEELVLR